MGTLLVNGTILNAADTTAAEVLIEGETIVQIGRNLPREGHRVMDATGKYLMPGGIDVHTHLDLPVTATSSSDDYETGHRAAAFGGTTSHIDFVIQSRGGSLKQAMDTWHAKAAGKAQIDYGFHMTIIDLRDEVAQEIPSMLDEGITSLKLLMAYKGALQVDDQTMFRTMKIAAEHGMLVMVHAENGDAIAELVAQALREGKTDPVYHALTRPAVLEGEATGRAIALATVTHCPLYVVHMTCEDSIRQLQRARQQSLPVMGETCIQYFFLTADDLKRPDGAKFVCSPPIRTAKDHEVLWRALRDQTLQVVSTDHCPFWYKGGVNGRLPGKELGKGNFSKIPNGVPSLEDRLKLLWTHGVHTGRISPNRFVELNSTNPAKIFGLYPHKGSISVGADADILVWDPHKRETISAQTHHMNVDYNIFEGQVIEGAPVAVFLRGNQLVDGDQWLGKPGNGQFLRRAPNAPVL